MQNVIAFPKQAAAQPVAPAATGAKTLFMHIKRSTLIMHVAAPAVATTANNRLGTKV